MRNEQPRTQKQCTMKKLFFLIPIIALLLLVSSCGGGSDDDIIGDNLSTDGSWEVGPFSYVAGVTVQNNSSEERLVIVSTTDQDMSNGAASGSAVAFTLNRLGAGEYTVSQLDFVVLNPNERLLSVNCTIGTAFVDATRYDVMGEVAGTAEVSVDADGIYTVNISKPCNYNQND